MRIARFESAGSIFTGSPLDDRSARVIHGEVLSDYRITNEVLNVDRWLAPIVPTDLLCIGLNYREHAIETGSEVPDNPMLFIKSSNALSDPGARIVLPRNTQQVDFEGELVVIIGKSARHVSKADALKHVFGYCVGNDVSARDWQKEKKLNGGQFARGKSFDGFAPIGPWIVTADEVPNPNALTIETKVSGETLQSSTTADMIFDVAAIISSLSETMTLRPGTAIFTGTPSGVGVARKPQRFLRPGDVVEITIEKLGTLSNPVVAE